MTQKLRFFPLAGAVTLLAIFAVHDAFAGPRDAPAASKVDVKTPLGQTLSADKIANPEADTPEGVILASIKMIGAGQFDAWMDTHCDPMRCETELARASMKTYNLPNARQWGPKCLHDGGGALIVTKVKGDRAADEQLTIYNFCGEDRLPVPSTLVMRDGKWKVMKFSW